MLASGADFRAFDDDITDNSDDSGLWDLFAVVSAENCGRPRAARERAVVVGSVMLR
jgi:hypothetical protein